MKIKSLQKYIALVSMLISSLTTYAQGIPAEQWTKSERQFVNNAKNLYQQQGINYSNEQAALAVQQMRQKQSASNQGIPESEWTAQDRNFVETAKRQYVANGMPFTTEQGQILVQTMRAQIARITGSMGSMQAFAAGNSAPAFDTPRQQAQQINSSNFSEEMLAKQLASRPYFKGPLSTSGRRDGFDVNGRPVLDSEGSIFSYASDVVTGDITYAVRTSRGLTIKTIASTPNAQPIVIASGAMGSAGWEFQTVTGKQLSGATLSILSNGFLVGRGSSAFRYQSGKGVQSIAIPNGYSITPLQHGNIGSTGYILLEKEGATGENDPVLKLFSSVKAIGSIIGVNKKEDYVLFDIASGKMHTMNISATGKQVTLMSQCHQVNWVISECQRAQTFESVYGTDGMKNNSHYYWLVNWMVTPTGPVAFTLEDGLGKLYITDLTTGKKVLAFDRSLGIADWNIEQSGDGKVAVKAKLALEWQEIPDANELLQSSN